MAATSLVRVTVAGQRRIHTGFAALGGRHPHHSGLRAFACVDTDINRERILRQRTPVRPGALTRQLRPVR